MIIPVAFNGGQYNIILENGAISRLTDFLDLKRKVLIVTDDNVPKEYAQEVFSSCDEPFLAVLEHGEKAKCFENFRKLLSMMCDYGFKRGDAVVAVGGGVVGDLAGFVAASYMRGVDFYNIPTTLLSMVDSSIGGKVAIDLDGVKNIVGAFYQPRCVVIDPSVLKTLDARQFNAGMVEALKMAATMDTALFELIENFQPGDCVEKIIEKALFIKRQVVENDPTEKGFRRVLNFGHTIGHAVESSKMGELLHGECVGLGMIPMCAPLARERIVKVLKRLGVPTSVKIDKESLIPYILKDKKGTKDGVVAVYCQKIGGFEFREVTPKEVVENLDLIIR